MKYISLLIFVLFSIPARAQTLELNGNEIELPYIINVASNNIRGTIHIDKFGAAFEVGTSWTILASAKTYASPTAATSLELVSSDNTNDIPAGTGARSVCVEGLGSGYQLLTWCEALNGTTAVPLDSTFTRVFRMYLQTTGTYASATASSHNSTITLRVASAGATWATIGTEANFGFGQSLIGAYTVPRGYTAYINGYDFTVESAKEPTFAFFKRCDIDDVTVPYSPMRLQGLQRGIASSFHADHILGPFNELCDIGFFGKVAASTASLSVDFEIILIKND